MESDLANLKYAFDETMSGYDAAASRLPQTYNAGRNHAAAQNALAQQSFNEFAAQLQMARDQFEWDQIMDQWQMEMTELELALKSAKSGSSSGSGSSNNKKYNNGSLTTEQVKIMQEYYGMTPDGMWSSENKNATNLSANQAWEQYIISRFYFGEQTPSNPSLTSVIFYEKEGIVFWNGKAYYNAKSLQKDILKAGLTHSQLSAFQKKLAKMGIQVELVEEA